MTAVPTALEAHERDGGHGAARQSVLARSVIASYTHPTLVEFPIVLCAMAGRELDRDLLRRMQRDRTTQMLHSYRSSRCRRNRYDRKLLLDNVLRDQIAGITIAVRFSLCFRLFPRKRLSCVDSLSHLLS